LSIAAKTILDQHVKNLKKHSDLKVLIEGHTSEIGTDQYNLNLSKQRAASVKQYFINKGLSLEHFPVKGYGEQYPAVIEENPQAIRSPAAKANMRVEFNIEKE
jgi:OOP family OmpA-OmpF porin